MCERKATLIEEKHKGKMYSIIISEKKLSGKCHRCPTKDLITHVESHESQDF